MFCLVGVRSEEKNVLDQLLDTPDDDDLDVEFSSPQKKLKSKISVNRLISHKLRKIFANIRTKNCFLFIFNSKLY